MAHAQPTPRIIPYLYVDDVAGYLEFLVKAFGFEKRIYEVDPGDDEHVHAEAALGDNVVMIGHANARWGTSSPRNLPALH
ncbi:MAG: VOC family protein, partial [Candidatus Binatia bacterium]